MKRLLAALSPAVERVAVHRTSDDELADDTAAVHPKQKVFVLETQPSSRMSSLGHCSLVLLLYLSFAVVLIIDITSYIVDPPMVLRSTVLSNRFPAAIPVVVTPRCAAAATTSCGAITVTVNYTNAETPAPCRNLGVTTRSVNPGQSVNVLLCYVPDEPWTTFLANDAAPAASGVYVSFSPSLVPSVIDVESFGVTVIGTAPTTPSLKKRLNVGHAEVRTLAVGAVKKDVSGELTAIRPYAGTYETDGYRNDNRTDIFLRLAPFAEVENTIAKESIPALLAGFGGAFKMLKLAATFLVPVFTVIFAKEFMDRPENPVASDKL